MTLQKVGKTFDSEVAVDALDLDVRDGEFLVLVGPSGCGKTTTLRMLAGLEQPTYGRILIGDRDVTMAPPGKRNVAMVFQTYALFPHMTVRQNLAFGPRVRGEQRKAIDARVTEVANVLGLDSLLDRKPAQLSGGQRQRVALGRAMLRQPDLFLLDEPLSNLDAALRGEMRRELLRLRSMLRVTTVYVTHDQVEAMTLGDRIAVMFEGKIVQIGAPAEIYSAPSTLMVAAFIGAPPMNLLTGTADLKCGKLTVAGARRPATIAVPASAIPAGDDAKEADRTQDIVAGVRPEHLTLGAPRDAGSSIAFSGRVDVAELLGAEQYVTMELATGERLTFRAAADHDVAPGDQVDVGCPLPKVHVFSAATGDRLEWHSPLPAAAPQS